MIKSLRNDQCTADECMIHPGYPEGGESVFSQICLTILSSLADKKGLKEDENGDIIPNQSAKPGNGYYYMDLLYYLGATYEVDDKGKVQWHYDNLKDFNATLMVLAQEREEAVGR